MHSSDPQCIFSNNFNEDYVIEPNSKVGLVNFKIQPIESVFDHCINFFGQTFKNVIRIGLSQANSSINYYNVIIDKDEILKIDGENATNLENNFILDNLTKKINNTIDMTEQKAIGLEFKCDKNSAPIPNKVNFKFKTFPYIDPKNLLTLENITYTELADQYKKNNSTSANLDTSNEERLYCADPFTRGNGFFRIRIDKFTEPNTAGQNFGFTIGLVQKNPVDFHPTLQEDIVIGINCPHATHNYRYVTNDVYHNSAVAPSNITGGGANNDVVELRRQQGKFQAVVYQANGIEHLLFEKDVSDLNGDPFDIFTSEALYPVIFFGAGDTNLVLSTPRVHLSPYDIISVYEAPLNDSTTYGTVLPIIPSLKVNTTSTFQLIFDFVLDDDIQFVPKKGQSTNNLAIFKGNFPLPDTVHYDPRKNFGRFLGFQLQQYNIDAVHAGGFIGDNDWIPTFTSKMYYLQAQNLELDTFSSIGKGKKNILLPMPLYNRFSNKFITYEPNNLYMVKLKNSNPMTMRNFRFRVLDENLQPISVVGSSHMTIVIE